MDSGYLRKAGLEVSNGELSFIYLKTVSPVTTNRLYSHNLKIFSNPKKFQKKSFFQMASFTHCATFAPPNFVRRTNTVIVILLIRKQSSEMKPPCPPPHNCPWWDPSPIQVSEPQSKGLSRSPMDTGRQKSSTNSI